MDADERALRERELRAQRKATLIASVIAALSFVVSALAVVASVRSSSDDQKQSSDQFRKNLQESTQQFRLNTRETLYNNIVTGLSSSAAAVQNNSMWLLEEYVQNRRNYDSHTAQEDGARDAIQTLDAFIEDNSAVKGHTGITYYSSPQPIILSRAILRLRDIDSDPALGSHDVDVSRGNFHGVPIGRFVPRGNFIAVGADFRRANLQGTDLHRGQALLDGAFLTCADLVDANLGDADMTGADLTGADLSGANLGKVQNLQSRQLRHATIDSATQLPPGVSVDRHDAWSSSSPKCVDLVNRMTGMHSGQGYTHAFPCPTAIAEARAQQSNTDPPFDGNPSDLLYVCDARRKP